VAVLVVDAELAVRWSLVRLLRWRIRRMVRRRQESSARCHCHAHSHLRERGQSTQKPRTACVPLNKERACGTRLLTR